MRREQSEREIEIKGSGQEAAAAGYSRKRSGGAGADRRVRFPCMVERHSNGNEDGGTIVRRKTMRIVKCDRCGREIHGDSNHISVWNEGGETVKASKYGGNDYCDECIAEIEKTIGALPPADGLNLREDSEEDKPIFNAIWNIIASLADIKDELERLEEVGARPVITAGVDWNGKPSIHVWDIKRIARIFGAQLKREDGEQFVKHSFEIDNSEIFGLEG